MSAFFKFSHNDSYTRGYPWVMAVDTLAAEKRRPPCVMCGTTGAWPDLHGEIRAHLEKGTKWPDVIGVGSPPPSFILSERVIECFHKEGVSGFTEHPVTIAECRSKCLSLATAPRYYYLDITGQIDIDIAASRADGAERCPQCFAYRRAPSYPATKFVPIQSTWDKSDIFEIRNIGGRGAFCTERILQQARRHRWMNFRFEPMDAVRRHTTRWKGIDYLGRKWPPTEWHPPAPSKGMPLAKWMDVFRENTYQAAPCHDALLDFEEEAVPPMIQFLHKGTDVQRKGAARVLYYLCYTCGVQLPKGVEDVLKKEMPDLYKY